MMYSPELVARSLRNTVVFDGFLVPFHDRFAQFSVDFPAGRPLGVGFVYPRAVQGTFQVTEGTLQLWLEENGQAVAVQRQELECLPWLTREAAMLPVDDGGLHIEAEHLFGDERTLVSEYRLTNHGSRAVTLRPRWAGMLPGDWACHRPNVWKEFEGINASPRETFLETLTGGPGGGVCGGIRVGQGEPHQPQMALRVRCVSHSLAAWVGDKPFWVGEKNESGAFVPGAGRTGHYVLGVGETLELAPGQTACYQFAVQVAYAWYRRPAFDFPASFPPATDFRELARQRQQEFVERLGSAPRPRGPAMDAKLLRARYTLLRDGTRGLDGEFGDNIACLCVANAAPFSTVFFWDALFSSVAISDFHAEYARGAIRAAFVRQSERDGSSPENKFNYPVPHRFKRQSPQAPVGSWAVQQYLRRHDDRAFLEGMYPILMANHRFWEQYSDTDRDGLAEWRWTGQTADNSPLYDQYTDGVNCGWIPPVASVSLNCFLYRDAGILAELADRLVRAEDAGRLRRRTAVLFERFMEVCFVPGEKRFWDFNHQTGEHRRIKTFYMFWPLFARMPIPQEVARELIENVLLDEKQFFGPMPFPSVAYDEPAYQADGYWRGKSWPHISYWLIETLVHYGYVREAREAARRIIAWYSAQPGFPENMTSDVALPNKAAIDYNWGIAAFHLLSTERYLG